MPNQLETGMRRRLLSLFDLWVLAEVADSLHKHVGVMDQLRFEESRGNWE